MNQILYVNTSKNGDGPLELKTVIRIFAIAIIVFGILMISKGVYNIIQNGNSLTTKTTIPMLTIEQLDSKLKLSIVHDKAINRISYSWNKQREVVLQGRGQTAINELIDIPQGDNTINIKILDINGKEATYQYSCSYSILDTTKPNIELIVEDSKLKIVAQDETKMAYISYFWNEEDETTVQVREDSLMRIEEKITILKGQNKLTVLAVDAAGNETLVEQAYIGAKRPKIDYTQEGKYIIITVSSEEEGIQKIELNVNGVNYSTDASNTGEPLGVDKVTFRHEIIKGINSVVMRVYSVNGLITEKRADITVE